MTLLCFILNPGKLSCRYFYVIHFILILIGVLIFLLCAENTNAAQVTLAWDPNTEPDLAGYNIYYGTSPGGYSQVIDVGNSTNYSVYNLTDGLTYYFAVTAYNSAGCESEYSNEVSTTVVRVISPNGFEVIPSGSIYSIYWLASQERLRFKLNYSLDNGLTWIQIADNIRGTSYNWGAPRPLGNKRRCLIKVEGYNESGAIIGEDISNAPFTIAVLRVESPNGGENLKSGSTWTIMWQTYEIVTSVATTELGYKTDGTDWKLTRTFTGNPGSYNLKVPYVTSPQKGMVAVRLKDSSGNVLGTDTSDTFFTIQP